MWEGSRIADKQSTILARGTKADRDRTGTLALSAPNRRSLHNNLDSRCALPPSLPAASPAGEKHAALNTRDTSTPHSVLDKLANPQAFVQQVGRYYLGD